VFIDVPLRDNGHGYFTTVDPITDDELLAPCPWSFEEVDGHKYATFLPRAQFNNAGHADGKISYSAKYEEFKHEGRMGLLVRVTELRRNTTLCEYSFSNDVIVTAKLMVAHSGELDDPKSNPTVTVKLTVAHLPDTSRTTVIAILDGGKLYNKKGKGKGELVVASNLDEVISKLSSI
jgi:hypothetical protein